MVVEVRGVRRASAYVVNLVNRLGVAYRGTTKAALDDLEKVASKYPPESDANRPKFGSFGPFYIRGEGSAYKRQDGHVTVYPTSEQLDRSWTSDIKATLSVIVGKVGPRASYGPFVVGEKQAPYHAQQGWPTLVYSVAAGFRGVVARFVRTTVQIVRRGR